jgi:hypothetical protein
MNTNLINQYQINFQNQIDQFEGYPKKIDKVPILNNEYLFQFLYDWSAEGFTDELLPAIEQVLNGVITEYETGSETTTLNIFQNKVDFYDNDLNYAGNIPTQDFKEICIGWRDFLQTPPLNGTIVP